MASVTLGPRPAVPRPHAEAPLARRTALVAFAFLAASALHLAWYGVDLEHMRRAFPLYALGGFSILIFGTSRLLIAGMAGRDIAGGAATSIAATVLGATGALLLYFLQETPFAAFASAPWSAAALLHVATIAITVRRAPTRPPIQDPRRAPSSAPAIRALEAGSLAYALASAIHLPLAYGGYARIPSALHVVLVGFVIVTILGTAAHILPRFTRTTASPILLYPLALTALAGPVLTAYGATRGGGVLRAGGLVQGLAFLSFGILVVSLLLRAHPRRAHHLAYLGAPLAVGLGGILALLYSFDPTYARYLSIHALLNVYGFAGLAVIAASTDLYGPALAPGAPPAKRHAHVAALLTSGALAAATFGLLTHVPTLVRVGMVAYAVGILWQFAGMVATHRRAERVATKWRRGERDG